MTKIFYSFTNKLKIKIKIKTNKLTIDEIILFELIRLFFVYELTKVRFTNTVLSKLNIILL